jgi:hypothetical protein
MTKIYKSVGIGLSVAGIILGLFFYNTNNSISGGVAGISTVILGLTCIGVAINKPLANHEFRNRNSIILILAAVFSIIDLILISSGNRDIGVYFILNAIAYLIITLFYFNLNSDSRAVFNLINVVILAGFLAVMAIKIIELLK